MYILEVSTPQKFVKKTITCPKDIHMGIFTQQVKLAHPGETVTMWQDVQDDNTLVASVNVGVYY